MRSDELNAAYPGRPAATLTLMEIGGGSGPGREPADLSPLRAMWPIRALSAR